MRLGLTLGDPAGIGPELVALAVSDGGPADEELVVYGDRAVLAAAAAVRGVALPPSLRVVEPAPLEGGWTPGRASPAGGAAQVAYLEAALADAAAGRLDALVTAPIHKAACRAAGFAFPGHTELLAARLGAPRGVTMMFAGPRLRVSLATIHCALADVPRQLSVDGVQTAVVQTAEALARDFGVAAPRVAVAGLNPHAGEAGHFGDEETRIVAPAIARAQAELGARATVTGPHVPDAVFRDAVSDREGGHRHDAVVALYHDQGLIPVKLIDFEEAVNVTLGLPIVRTSPDHGVAYDLAGTGRARPTSFRAAVRLARGLAAGRANWPPSMVR
jgi:4-hydroxythreonine-4-phosphate dehydrogenase